MEYSKLVSVTGIPGLFELVASKADGAIIRSLDDKSTRFVSSRIHNFSHLESIEVYTERENVNLADVFHAMQSNTEKLPDEKDAKAVKTYFEKVYPSMDFERVYASDMKKMIKWFDILSKKDIEIKLSEEEPETEESIDETVEAPVVESAAATKSKEKKADKTENDKEKKVKKEPVKEIDSKADTAEEKEPKKAKVAKAKKVESITSDEGAPVDTETKPAKKKITKK